MARPKQPTSNATTWVQGQSPLLRLPQELKDIIYDHVFSTTELSFDGRPYTNAHFMSIRTTAVGHQPHYNASSLALLRTCRRLRHEIGDTWISKVRFSFFSLWNFERVLARVPAPKLSEIRLVHVLEASFDFWSLRVYQVLHSSYGVRSVTPITVQPNRWPEPDRTLAHPHPHPTTPDASPGRPYINTVVGMFPALRLDELVVQGNTYTYTCTGPRAHRAD
ncbi:hypothetical protein GE09DRAFT_1266147 [Coniochaeta sp. 2T2.1]|nr:hypothetical protein GE09DRAFT_1266147 [Coniochaeta sp. 2T2.1]